MLALPPAFGVLLILLRPDLVLPLLRRPIGAWVVLAVTGLAALGAGLTALGLWLIHRFTDPERRWGRRLTTALAVGLPLLVFTGPAIALALMAPIVYAFAEEAPPDPGSGAVRPLLPVLE